MQNALNKNLVLPPPPPPPTLGMISRKSGKFWKLCSRVDYLLLCFGFYFLLKQSPITIWRSHQMSDYDWIIEKFILKSKTKWVDGLQFMLYSHFVTKQIGVPDQSHLCTTEWIYILQSSSSN